MGKYLWETAALSFTMKYHIALQLKNLSYIEMTTWMQLGCNQGGAGKRILVGQAPNKKWAPGGALLHRSMNIGMAVAIPAIPPAPSLGATNILTR